MSSENDICQCSHKRSNHFSDSPWRCAKCPCSGFVCEVRVADDFAEIDPSLFKASQHVQAKAAESQREHLAERARHEATGEMWGIKYWVAKEPGTWTTEVPAEAGEYLWRLSEVSPVRHIRLSGDQRVSGSRQTPNEDWQPGVMGLQIRAEELRGEWFKEVKVNPAKEPKDILTPDDIGFYEEVFATDERVQRLCRALRLVLKNYEELRKANESIQRRNVGQLDTLARVKQELREMTNATVDYGNAIDQTVTLLVEARKKGPF